MSDLHNAADAAAPPRFVVQGTNATGWNVIQNDGGLVVPGCDDYDYADDAQRVADDLNAAGPDALAARLAHHRDADEREPAQVCAGTGNHDGQDVQTCDECDPDHPGAGTA